MGAAAFWREPLVSLPLANPSITLSPPQAPAPMEASSSQSLAEVAERLAQTEQLAAQLKEIIREKDAALSTKDEQLKVHEQEYAAKQGTGALPCELVAVQRASDLHTVRASEHTAAVAILVFLQEICNRLILNVLL